MSKKQSTIKMSLDPTYNKINMSDLVVHSHDKNSYQLNFEFSDGCDNPLPLTDAKPRILFVLDNNIMQLYQLKIDSENLGEASFTFVEPLLHYEGIASAYVYVDYEDKKHDIGGFKLKFKKSAIDGEMPEIEGYIEDIDKALKKVDELEVKISENDLVRQPELKEVEKIKANKSDLKALEKEIENAQSGFLGDIDKALKKVDELEGKSKEATDKLDFQVSFKQNTGVVSTHSSDVHNAFPDVSYSKLSKKYYLVFRGGEKHAEGRNGTIFLAESEDGIDWSEPTMTISDTFDLRDPSLAILEDGSFILSCFKYQKEPAIGETWVYKSTDNGFTWSSSVKVGEELLQYTTDKVIEISSSKLLLPIYQGGASNGVVIRIYQSSDNGDSWSMLSFIGDPSGWNSSEPILYNLSTGKLICLIRTAQNIGSPQIKIATSEDEGKTWSDVSNLGVTGHASGMIENNGYLYTGARISSDNYEWYGRVVVYKIDIETLSVIDTINLDLNPRKDNAYTSFASSDDRELIISYYAYEKSFGTLPEIKIIKTTFESLETKSMLINPQINASQIVAPYIFEDDQQGLGVIRVIQHNKNGRLIQFIDHNFNKVLEIDFTEDANGVVHPQIYGGSEDAMLWVNPPGRNGCVKMMYGDGWIEINKLGASVFKKIIDSRGGANFYTATALRIPNDVSSGYVPVAVREAGTTAQRPIAVPTGYEFFDTTLGMPIWRRGGGWIDGAKNIV